MKDDDITREQMTEFCERARAAVAADRAVLVTSVQGHTNLCASVGNGGTTEDEVTAELIADLARAIVSMNPALNVTLRNPKGEELTFTFDGTNMHVRQRIIEDVSNEVG
jgi:hypothetical protein